MSFFYAALVNTARLRLTRTRCWDAALRGCAACVFFSRERRRVDYGCLFRTDRTERALEWDSARFSMFCFAFGIRRCFIFFFNSFRRRASAVFQESCRVWSGVSWTMKWQGMKGKLLASNTLKILRYIFWFVFNFWNFKNESNYNLSVEKIINRFLIQKICRRVF